MELGHYVINLLKSVMALVEGGYVFHEQSQLLCIICRWRQIEASSFPIVNIFGIKMLLVNVKPKPPEILWQPESHHKPPLH